MRLSVIKRCWFFGVPMLCVVFVALMSLHTHQEPDHPKQIAQSVAVRTEVPAPQPPDLVMSVQPSQLPLVLEAMWWEGSEATPHTLVQRRTPVVDVIERTRPNLVTLQITRNHRVQYASAVLVDIRGFAVTSLHAVVGANSIIAYLADGKTEIASLHRADPACDLAILCIRGYHSLYSLAIGSGSKVMVGETVIALGNPHGHTATATTGIVSAVKREIVMPDGTVLTNLIQTSAAISRGSSGGPLLNIHGEMIGIVTAVQEGAQNIGFAVPADDVTNLLSRALPRVRR